MTPAPEPAHGKGALLFSESFEGLSDTHTWAPVDLAAHGWKNAGSDTEVAWGGENKTDPTAYSYGLHSTDGHYWLDTQATTGPINTSHTFADANGGRALLSFDIASEAAGTYANQTFEFKVNDVVVKDILAWNSSARRHENSFYHFEVLVNTIGGTAGNNTLTMHDTSSPSNDGFAIDNILVHDWII